MKVLQKTLLIAMAAAVSAPALAYEAGDIVVRAGAIQVSPDAKNNTVVAGLDVDDNTQLGLTVSYMLTPNMAVELVGATPFKHDITLNGSTVGSVEHLPPTVMAQYFPMASGSAVQPYVGIGVNYTKFWGEEASGALAGSVLSVEDSVGLAVEAGIDYQINDKFVLNASVWKIDINTDVSLNGAPLGELEIDPMVAFVGVGYKF